MTAFIIIMIIMAGTVGVFFGLMFTSSMGGVCRGISTVIIALVIGSIISGLLTLQAYGDTKAWNEGICPTCGEPWHLVNVEHLRHGSVISYYACDNCQEIIEIHGMPY